MPYIVADKKQLLVSGVRFMVTGTNTYTLATGGTNFNNFDPVVDASNVVAQMEESILDGCKWYMHRTAWAGDAPRFDQHRRHARQLDHPELKITIKPGVLL